MAGEKKIKVLVVDDSLVVRKIVSDILSEDADIEVVGTASNGKFALPKIPLLQPNIITLDIEMPEMNGIETLKRIRADYPKLPVIMFSSFTEAGAKETLEALANGASDYVAKPSSITGSSVPGGMTAKDRIREQLLEKVKALYVPDIAPPAPVRVAAPIQARPSNAGKIGIVAIGVSTGGPTALAELLSTFPADFSLPIVITQHMPPVFTKMLAERLSLKGTLPAFEGAEGMEVLPGKIYLAPGDFHMELKRVENKTIIHLQQERPENSCRPAVDVMFRSVVKLYGAQTLGVILTGMGADGMIGCEHIRNAGGQVIAQDRASSVVWGMPGAVSDAGLADVILPLNGIKQEICRRVSKPVGVTKTFPKLENNKSVTI